jgi:murein DD-endopeptidase MepM/ murein hydrolase activator NlpD
MRRQFTLLIIDDKGSPVRETRFSKRLIWLLTAILVVCFSALGVGAYEYAHLYYSVADKATLQVELKEHQADIEEQRKQIQAFAQSINELKSNLLALNGFESKIRIMANLEHKADQADLFSIGGSMPDDLDTDIALNEDHDRLVRQMHNQISQVNHATAVQHKSIESLLDSLKDKRNLLVSTPSLRPAVGWVSSEFGYRVSPFTGRRELHKGVDIANRQGTPIIAPADGLITFADNKWLIGNMVTIEHGFGMVTNYGHLHKLLKKKGDRVKRGELIALMGSTGRSTGPHVHYEVRLNGVPVNPENYILD